MVRNPPSNAGDVGSILGRGTRILHVAGQLSPHAATTEPTCSRARAPQLESPHAATTEPACSGVHTPQLEDSLRAATTDLTCQTRCSQINKYIYILKSAC